MSLVLVDLGNTRLKWARAEGGRLGPMAALAHHSDPRQLQRAALFDLSRPARVVCASVARRGLEQALADAVASRWGLEVEWTRTAARSGELVNGYSEPRQMGVDRWLAMSGAWHQTREAFAVVDAGSAITVDAVADDGRHLGGWILPGRRLMMRGLARDTAHVNPPGLETAPTWGQDTAGCVAAGVEAATVGAMRQLQRVLAGRAPCAPIFLCGGDAEAIRHALDGDLRLQPDLVLRGLMHHVES